MDVLTRIAAVQGGVVMRSQAFECGLSTSAIDQMVRRGRWLPLRRGAYVERETFDALTPEQQCRAMIHAATRSLRMPGAVSHVSAALLHGLPLWGLDLSEVHVTRSTLGSPRREAGVHHHSAELRDDEIVTIDGLRATSLARTVIDTARMSTLEAAVVVADAAARRDVTVKQVALERVKQRQEWPGMPNAGLALAFADGRSESVGESRGRMAIWRAGLPKPELQFKVYEPDGQLIGRTDYAFPDKQTLGEFDGRGKYSASHGDGDDPGLAVWREKRREDRLRGRGFEVVRFAWADLDDPVRIGIWFRDAFARRS